MFGLTYREIIRMLRGELLNVPTARTIARRAGIRTNFAPDPEIIRAPNPSGVFSWPQHDDYGYEGVHDAGLLLPFPRDTPTIYLHDEDITVRQGDFRSVTEARLVVNVTGVGTTGASLIASVDDGTGDHGFTVAPPSAPLDEIGCHVSPWREFGWDSEAGGIFMERIRWLVDNPGSTSGDFYVGFCQLQTR